MFLLQQLRRSIDTLPPGVQAAVFCETSGHTVQMRGLTAQHASLESGIAECIPRLPTTVQDSFASGIQQLLTVAAILQPLPRVFGGSVAGWSVSGIPAGATGFARRPDDCLAR